MSSEIAVKAISIIHTPTQDATGRNNRQVADTPSVSPVAEGSHQSPLGKSLPNSGSKVPFPLLKGRSNQTQGHSVPHKEVVDAVRNLNDYAQNTQRELNFSIDDQTGQTVVKVVDHETKEVIRQIPAEEVLIVARRIAEDLDAKGHLFKVKA